MSDDLDSGTVHFSDVTGIELSELVAGALIVTLAGTAGLVAFASIRPSLWFAGLLNGLAAGIFLAAWNHYGMPEVST